MILVDGSAIAVDRGATGAQGLSSLWRITPQADGTPDPDPEPEPEPEPATGVTVDGTPAVGGEITLNGVGWKHPDGSGSTIGLKLDDGSVKRASDGTDVWATIEADDDGEFSVTFQLPDGTTEGEHGSTPAFTAGEHTLRFLSGSLKPGDQGRSVAVTIDVAEAGTEPEPEEPTDPDVTEPKPVKKKSKVNTSIKKKIKAKKRGKLKVVVKPGHANEKVVVAIDGKTWKNVKLTRKNAKKAVATVKLPKLKVGKHKVRVVFNGNAVAKKGTAVAKFRVVR
ncbi:hypothetical protein [Nocardioides alcanivorans]|uniref:hypothetical protein n=1 Tax=Nocardioides alcanivorans TaxID=2897352 RepID=UPI001F1E61B6|nr:hypothetical protein [Nocardioides alcanivorans]